MNLTQIDIDEDTDSSWTRLYCSVLNRFGALEGKLLLMKGEFVQIRPLERKKEEEQHHSVKKVVKGVIKKGKNGVNLLSESRPPLILDNVAWVIHRRQVAHLRLQGGDNVYMGVYRTAQKLETLQLRIKFPRPQDRDLFVDKFRVPSMPLTQTPSHGRDADDYDLRGGWRLFKVAKLSKTTLRVSRTYALNVVTRTMHVFKTSELEFGEVSELSTPVRSYLHISNGGIHIENSLKHSNKLRWSIVQGWGNYAKTDYHELVFDTYSEREDFSAHLKALGSPLSVAVKLSSVKARENNMGSSFGMVDSSSVLWSS